MCVIKIAIITDVHGNAPALKAALSEIDNRRDIEHIYCLGDMVAIGPDTNEVLHMLFSRADVSMYWQLLKTRQDGRLKGAICRRWSGWMN